MVADRRDLFSELAVVFMDTTTLYFEGRGGSTLGQKGHTKDYRPHLNQMVVGIIMDQDGRPVCSEMWPGNTTDVTTLLPVIDRLRQRFAIGRVCVVADRGMISDATIAGLEERKLEYILGVRERNSKEVYEIVLNDRKPSVPLVIPRSQRSDTELEAKNVWVGDRRYVVCRNLAEAKRDAEVREAVLRSLRESLRSGDKALVGNSAYRRYLKTPDDKHFEIDEKRVVEDARYDGLYVLRTNMRLDALAVMLRYRELLKVEDIFRTTKSILDTRPIYHQTNEAIRGHVFCSFLALVLRKALEIVTGTCAWPSQRALVAAPTALPAGNRNRTGGQALRPAHARRRRRRPRLPSDRHRPAAQHPRGRGGRAARLIGARAALSPRKRGANNPARVRNYRKSKPSTARGRSWARGRPKIYGKKTKLTSLLADIKSMQQVPSPVYGECNVTLRYRVRDLLWRPAGRLVRFVAVIHPTRGACILMCTDTSLSAVDIIRLYGLRFKDRAQLQTSHAPDRLIRLPLLDERHDPVALSQRQSIPPSQIGRLPKPCQTQNARLSHLHPGRCRRPGTAPVSRRRRPEARLGLLRVLAANHSSRYPTIGAGRRNSTAPDTSRLSPGFLESNSLTKFITERQDTQNMRIFRLAS